ncbi:hypothetical protein, partial [Ralstonia pseudosolanacearum]|uniref:hypothetical protein n=1 Tax=Ralstonia pseudosolanacearum TaxID=1310165 RepID=UPI001FF83BDF
MAIFHHRFFCRILNAKKKPATGGQLKQECDAICRHLGHWGMGVYAYRIIESALLNLKNVSARFHATLDAAAWPVAVV